MVYEGIQNEVRETPADMFREESVAADSLPGTYPPESSEEAVKIFGPYSSLSRQDQPPSAEIYTSDYLTGVPAFSAVVLICFVSYCLLVSRFKGQVAAVLGIFRGRSYVEKLLDTQNYLFDIFLRLALMLWFLMVAVTVVKFADLYAGAQIAVLLPDWSVGLLSIAAWAAIGSIWMFQTALLRVAGSLTMSRNFTDTLAGLRKLVFTLACVLLAPLMLMFSMSEGANARIFSFFLAVLLGAILIILLMRTYILFIGQKISILYWILYLCTVEIFPISFLALLAQKYMI